MTKHRRSGKPDVILNADAAGFAPESGRIVSNEYALGEGRELSVIAPTYNECENVAELVLKLHQTLDGVNWEIIVVDDNSPDGTAILTKQIAQNDGRVRCIQRIGRRGLSSACIEGMLASTAPYLAVIDSDLQHDETLLPKMLQILKKNEADVVVGSRYMTGGSVGEIDQSRALISRLATRLSRLILRANLTDPMSGFFMLTRRAFEERMHNLSGIGFKILLDLFASGSKPLQFKELPYRFKPRETGESKLDTLVVWEYGMLLADKTVGRVVPVRFVAFSFVGGLGVFAHLTTLAILHNTMNLQFAPSQAIATYVAITVNFILNNMLTYRDMRRQGWGWIRGWVSFTLACSVGAVANIGIASYLFNVNTKWIAAALAGIVVGAVWNYAVTAVYTWRSSG